MGLTSRGGAGAEPANRGGAMAGRAAVAVGQLATAKMWPDPARVAPDLAAGRGAAASYCGSAVNTDDDGPIEKRVEEAGDKNVNIGVAAAVASPLVGEPSLDPAAVVDAPDPAATAPDRAVTAACRPPY
ncbi:hypothetical protein GUJ93_ZPchr0002g26674 [Zizania palustris]|uniref:Uncharacterized protein n=1 Tax=Zizania palustris TaxID=103762 RepID=A0A8J5SEP6_ZIZPA|nr:hypothetical protein GUJ93_ZPchr0002g26674 [Zizania palustris]